jgi:uncharacterized protein (TIGR03067 family)
MESPMGFIVYVLLTCAPPPSAPRTAGQQPPKGDLGALQGTWNLRRLECEMRGSDIDPGGPQPSPDVFPLLPVFGIEGRESAPVTLSVQGKYLTSSRGAELLLRPVFEARLDEGKSPGAIDLVVNRPSGPVRALLGIYKLEGDRFTLCVALGDRRPTEFKAAAGQIVLHYERSDNDKAIHDILDRIKKK